MLFRLFFFIKMIEPASKGAVVMSKLSFKVFCIEMYARHKTMPGAEVYALFEKEGVLDMLDRDYDVLHGFGFEYIVRDIDHYIGGERM